MSRRVAGGLAIALCIALTLALGVWQWQRAQTVLRLQQSMRAASADASLEAPSLASKLHQSIRLQGRFLPQPVIYLDNRMHEGRAGFLVLSLFIAEGDVEAAPPVTWLVQRGWHARDPRARAQGLNVPLPPGPIMIEGWLRASLPRSLSLGRENTQSDRQGVSIRQNVDIAALSREWERPLAPFVLYQSSDSGDGLIRDTSPGAVDTCASLAARADRHRGYMVQWWAMSLAFVVIGLRQLKRRNKT